MGSGLLIRKNPSVPRSSRLYCGFTAWHEVVLHGRNGGSVEKSRGDLKESKKLRGHPCRN